MENKIKIIALFGKAGAGKDTILNELFNTYGSVLPINRIPSFARAFWNLRKTSSFASSVK